MDPCSSFRPRLKTTRRKVPSGASRTRSARNAARSLPLRLPRVVLPRLGPMRTGPRKPFVFEAPLRGVLTGKNDRNTRRRG